MSAEELLFYIFAGASTLYVVHFGIYLIGANFYDMWQFRRQHQLLLRPAKNDALVTILIPAHNEQLVIARCLDSITKSTYRNLQIIVVDDASKDLTSKLVRDYSARHPSWNIRTLRKRRNVGKGAALNHALRRLAKGEFVMTVDADSVIEPDTVANAVAYFDDPTIVGVAANVRLMEEHTVLGILQKFEHMIGYRSKKTYSITKSEFVIGGVASTYRMSVLREVGYYDTDTLTEDIGLSIKIISLKGNRHQRIVYAADVSALTESVQSFRGLLKQRYRWKYGSLQNVVKYRHLMFKSDRKHHTLRLTWYRLPMAIVSEIVLLLTPLMWGYVLYLSFATDNLQLIMGAYLTITVYVFINLWFDEHIRGMHRVRLSLYVPIMYVVFYIMDIVQFAAAIRCLAQGRRLVTGKDGVSTWVSPRRTGRQVVAG